ncbi:MAG TPA: hypothetical protein VM925_04740, partial [Labilithrix sp.]|nr:hypothetical protein [Labilithrix sp.]
MRLGAALVGVAILFGANVANAALTSSEKGQIKDFVAAARAEDAQKVRSLVARTDLGADESAAVLTEAITPVAFTDQRGIFLKELAFGGASAPSRPVLVLAEVKALLARADAIYQRYVGGLDHEPRAIQELVAIYGWLDQVIANAGKPTVTSHDGSAGIPTATYEECSKVLRDHVERQARWIKGDGVIPGTVARLRAQAHAALLDMLPDGLTRRVDAAQRLGLKGARRTMLVEWGILFADAGTADDAKVERVRQILTRLPGARVDLAVIYAGGDRGESVLRARGAVVHVAPSAERYPFSEEVAPGTYDAAMSAISHDLSVVAARRALDARAELRAQVERDAAAASGDAGRLLGRPRAPSVEHVLGAAIHTLLVDAPRAIDVSFARLLGSRPETAALLSDAVGALAAFGAEEKDGKAARIELGKANGWTPVTAIHLAPNGAALGFTIDGHAWSIDRATPSYAVMGGRRDGQPVSPSQLSAKGIPRDGTQWIYSGYTFNKRRGAPRVALSAGAEKGGGPNVKLLGTGADGFDVVAVAAPAPDFSFEGELAVRDAPGGIALRASTTKKGFRGVALIVTPGGRTVLALVDVLEPPGDLPTEGDVRPDQPLERLGALETGRRKQASVDTERLAEMDHDGG